MRYSIIARDREPHTNRARANLILTELKHTLIPYVTDPHIQFQKPNFIIYLQDPGLQHRLLSKQMLQTHTFTLDLVAWSTENEMAQIPWMTGTNYNRLFNHFLPTKYNHAMATKKNSNVSIVSCTQAHPRQSRPYQLIHWQFCHYRQQPRKEKVTYLCPHKS